ncbi:hypothetical protein SDC9_153860 [bioreactor metagenome]|uniref:Aminodeoxychorismate lyase n=1 Tax=bioreactor metagenome TaxID=1076179 RepID=A0A645F1V6_9ZZZZ
MRETCIGAYNEFHFENIFEGIGLPESGLFRLNIWYNRTGTEIKISPYVPAEIKKVAVVTCDPDFDYSRKYSDRTALNELLTSASGADEIIIIKNGFVTDTSKANIVFEKDGVLYTPDTFLLNGTMRQYLHKTGKIIEKTIRAEDIPGYEKMYFINALNPLETAPVFNRLPEIQQ